MPSSIQTLWVDDHIDKMEPFIRKLNSSGFNITAASTVDQAIVLCSKNTYNLIIADIRMEPIDGIAFLKQVDSVQPQAGRVIITSFSYLQKYKDRINNLDFSPDLIEKPLPNYASDQFNDKVIEPLINCAKTGRKSEKTHSESNLGMEVDPFLLSFHDFMDLTIEQKDYFNDLAINHAKTTIEEEFNKGNVWILLCGSKHQARASVKDFSKIPEELEILNLAENLDSAPYQVSRNITPEDMWTTCPASDSSMHNYPTITLRVKNIDITSHFDTGAPITFFSYEDLVDMDGIESRSLFIPAVRNETQQVYRFSQMKFICKIVCQDNFATKAVEIKGQAVRNWQTSPFNRPCKKECENKSPTTGNGDICKYRHALIGRNILSENEIQIVLDGKKLKTKIGREE